MKSTARRRESPFIPLFCVELLIVLMYFPVLDNFFLLDDLNWLKRGLTFYKEPLSLFRPTEDGFLRPVMILLYAGLVPLVKTSPVFYYALNIFLHMVNTLLVYLFACGIFPPEDKKPGALISALCFAAMFAHYQAVVWLAAVPHLVATTCFLASWLFYMKFKEKKARVFYGLSLFAFLCAIFTRESAMALPLILFFYEWLFSGKEQRKTAALLLLPYFAVIAFHFFIYAVFVQFNYAGGRAQSITSFLLVRVVFNCILELFLTCFGFIAGSSFAFSSGWFKLMGILNMFFFFVLFAVSWKHYGKPYFLAKGKWKAAFFGLAFTACALALFVSPFIVPYGIFHRNRYFYLPSAGFSVFLAVVLCFFYRGAPRGKPWALYALMAGMFAANAAAVRSVETYFEHSGRLSYGFYRVIQPLPCPQTQTCELLLVDFPQHPWIVFIPPFFEQLTAVFKGENWQVRRMDGVRAPPRLSREGFSYMIEFKNGRFYNTTHAHRKLPVF